MGKRQGKGREGYAAVAICVGVVSGRSHVVGRLEGGAAEQPKNTKPTP
jgi:hypothetical protein